MADKKPLTRFREDMPRPVYQDEPVSQSQKPLLDSDPYVEHMAVHRKEKEAVYHTLRRPIRSVMDLIVE